MPNKAGKMRHKVAIQEQTETPDGMGGFTPSWGNVTGLGSVPAAIWPLSSKESLDAMKLESRISEKIKIRYRAGITSKNRIVFGSQIFNIQGAPINIDQRNKYLIFMVSEDI